jgi:hypothetical protein
VMFGICNVAKDGGLLEWVYFVVVFCCSRTEILRERFEVEVAVDAESDICQWR